MRFSEDKIRDALLHPDLDVRDAAVRYFYSSTARDPALMPRAIEAIEQYGRIEAFSLTHPLNVWPQTDATIGWVIAELQSEFQALPEERHFYFLNLSRLLCHADIRLVAGRAAEISQAPHFDPKEQPAFRERLDMFGWSAEVCWNALRQFCEDNRDKNHVEELDLGHAVRVVEALARQPHEYHGPIVDILAEHVQDVSHDARRWLQPLMANLAGEMRLRAAVPLLVGNLGHPSSFQSDQSMFALAKIGTEDVVTAVCDSFPGGSRNFRLYASDLLGKIHGDLTAERILGLLPGESDLPVRINLCHALLDHFRCDGVEPARQLIRRHELTPDLRRLRSTLVATGKLTGLRFPEFDDWQEQARNDARAEQKSTRLFRKLVYEAGGDMNVVVSKLKAEISRERREAERLEAELARGRREAERLEAELARAKMARGGQARPQVPRRSDRTGVSSSERVQVGRNDPCPCRSGKKFKHCCLKNPTGY